ncbi:MAG: Hint domain-containing protein [Acetobacteraceae bacterium]|nr:Hint domain-containing protein [Acetobacteraceae bacterium]
MRGNYGSSTVNNAGVITGTGGKAVKFNTGQTNRVIDNAGAVFNGTVDGGTPASATLEFASGATTGTISGIGSNFINFGHVDFDAGANWVLSGNNIVATGATVSNASTLAGGLLRLDGTNSFSNSGSLTNAGGIALQMYGGSGAIARVTNLAGGLISGTLGVRGSYASTTITNAGTITGTGGTAVQLNLFQTNRVVVNAGAVFNGAVNGGNTGADLGGSTLEFASTAATGTVSGLGSKYFNFGHVNFDAGSNWVLSGNNAIVAGGSAANAGTLTGGALQMNGSSAFTNTGLLTDAGGIGVQLNGNATAASTGLVTNAAGALISGTTGVRGTYGSVTVNNAGTITGTSGTAVQLNLFQTNRVVVNVGAVFNGTVNGGNTGAYLYKSTLEFAASGYVGALSGLGSHYINFGNINFDASSKWILNGTNSNIAGANINVAAGASLAVFGTITGAGALINNGTITAAATAVADFGAVTGTGTIQISGGGLAQFGAGAAATQHVGVLNNTGTLVLDPTKGFAATVSGMTGGDVINLSGLIHAGQGLSVGIYADLAAGNVLNVTEGNKNPAGPHYFITSLQLDQTQNFTGHNFQIAQDATGNFFSIIEDNIPCFLAGTMIETTAGDVAVEALRAGDMVQTLSGSPRPIVWIGSGRTLVTPRNRCDVSPVIIRAGALADNVPVRDLHVTRHHAMLVGDVLVPAEHLVNGASVVWDDTGRVIEYYHVELDAHDILIADGAPTESFRDDGNASQFQNYGSRPARNWQQPCRPVIEHGPELETAWRLVAARAGRIAARLFTPEPDLHLLVDGVRVDGKTNDGALFVFTLPPDADQIEIVSNTTIPAINEHHDDRRRLGVAIGEMTIWRQNAGWPIALQTCQDGWHAMADGHRWTKGRASLSLPRKDTTRLEILTIPGICYRAPAQLSGRIGRPAAAGTF